MSESGWAAYQDFPKKWGLIAATMSGRKLRLFTAACSRRYWHLFELAEAKWLVNEAERLAEVPGDEAGLRLRASDAYRIVRDLSIPWLQRTLTEVARHCVFCANPAEWGQVNAALHALVNIGAHTMAEIRNPQLRGVGLDQLSAAQHLLLASEIRDPQLREVEWQAMGCLLKEMVGNPFQKADFAPHWRTDDVRLLSEQMFESRDFGAMPILADALQDAGCDSDDILSHCRGSGPHVRGCWVVDLILGKE
jgi:hypothetical protein